MTHKAETILAAVQSALETMPNFGGNVFRGRTSNLSKKQVPAVLISMGQEQILEAHTQDRLLVGLDVILDFAVYEKAAVIDTRLNEIRAEATAAIAADHTLGLAFVQMIEEVSTGEPSLSTDGAEANASQRMDWLVTYARSRTNPAA